MGEFKLDNGDRQPKLSLADWWDQFEWSLVSPHIRRLLIGGGALLGLLLMIVTFQYVHGLFIVLFIGAVAYMIGMLYEVFTDF